MGSSGHPIHLPLAMASVVRTCGLLVLVALVQSGADQVVNKRIAKDATPTIKEASAEASLSSLRATQVVQPIKIAEEEVAYNPYIHTTATAEALAALFAMVAFVICWIECCK